MKLNPAILEHRVRRARSAAGQAIRYALGRGGFNPRSALPDDGLGACDCSGFVAWTLQLSRKPKASRPWWIETTQIVRDASGRQSVFVRLEQAVPGCLVVFPDRRVAGVLRHGHAAVVTGVGATLTGVDCSSSSYKEFREAILERRLSFMADNPRSVFCTLRQDLLPEAELGS